MILNCASLLGVSPFVIDTSSLSVGIHNITIRAIVDGIVQGIATQSFEVLECMRIVCTIIIPTHVCFTLAAVVLEFKETSYSVLESDRVFNVTLVKQGNLNNPIRVSITASDITTSSKCVTVADLIYL